LRKVLPPRAYTLLNTVPSPKQTPDVKLETHQDNYQPSTQRSPADPHSSSTPPQAELRKHARTNVNTNNMQYQSHHGESTNERSDVRV